MPSPDYSWQAFIGRHADPYDAFQALAKRYFCAELEIDIATLEDPDHFPGVECMPLLHKGLHKSFQAKFSQSNKVLYSDFEDSLEKAIKFKKAGAFDLDQIYFFTNGPPPTPKLDHNQQATESKRQKLDKAALDAGITIKWRFGKNILDKLDVPSSEAFDALRKFFFAPGPQPKLNDPRSTTEDGSSPYHYSAQAIPYVSRVAIEDDIHKFLHSAKPLSWFPLVGAAGIGKSRLILNVCESLGPEWNWGWWTKGSKFNFSQWDPSRPTLLVIDYVMGRLPEIQSLFDALLANAPTYTSPVRLILAERLDEPWIKLLCQQQTTGPQVTELAFAPSKDGFPVATDLAEMSTTEKLALSSSVLTMFPDSSLEPSDLVDQTCSIDSSCRPLIMWLVADRATESDTLPTIEALLRENIERQRMNRWIDAGVTENHEHQAAIVTITGGVPLDPAQFKSNVALDQFSNCDIEKHDLIVSRKSLGKRLHPFEPDIIGELHALDTLQGQTPLDSGSLSDALAISVGVDGGSGAIGFLFRAASDFPSHPVLATLDQTNLNSDWHGNISQFLVISLVAKGPNKSRQSAWNVIESLRNRLAVCAAQEKLTLKRAIATCAVNISYGSQDQDDFDKVVAIESEIRTYAKDTGDDRLLDYHSKAASNLIRNNGDEYSTKDLLLDIAQGWFSLALGMNYPVEAWRQLYGSVDAKFSNAVNAQSKQLDNADVPDSWFSLLVDIVSQAKDPTQCDISFSSAVGRSFEQLNQIGEFDQAAKYVSALIDHIAAVGPPSQGGIASLIWTDIQKKKNSGNGNPHSPVLLSSLAAYDPHAGTLLPHI